MVNCSICNWAYNPNETDGFFSSTCSKECARVARLAEQLFSIWEMLRDIRNVTVG